MHALCDAGILVHAYLMYGYPTQTAQETIDALEFVRGLFCQGSPTLGPSGTACPDRSQRRLSASRSKLCLRILDDRETAFSRNEIPFDELEARSRRHTRHTRSG